MADLIDRYVSELRRQLRGPILTKSSIVREVKDGLRDAAAGHQQSGLPAATAVERAICEAGSARDLAAGFGEELAAAAARRTAVLVLTGTTAGFVTSTLAWQGSVDDTPPDARAVPDAYQALALGIDAQVPLIAITAVAAFWLLTRGGRLVTSTRRLVRSVAWATLALLGIRTAGGALLTIYAPIPVNPGPVSTVIVVVSTTAIAWSAVRCLVLTSVLPIAVAAHHRPPG